MCVCVWQKAARDLKKAQHSQACLLLHMSRSLCPLCVSKGIPMCRNLGSWPKKVSWAYSYNVERFPRLSREDES